MEKTTTGALTGKGMDKRNIAGAVLLCVKPKMVELIPDMQTAQVCLGVRFPLTFAGKMFSYAFGSWHLLRVKNELAPSVPRTLQAVTRV